MKIIVGLGNFGSKYELTRHNMGFRVIDELAATFESDDFKYDLDSLILKVHYKDELILLVKPQTYMNLSGQAVAKVMDYYKASLEDLLVISDDLSLEPGRIRLREKGSSGGQKGLQNIIDMLHTEEFKRLRIGIGEPKGSTIDYVLGVPNKEDMEKIDEAIQKAVDAIIMYLSDGYLKASSKYNSKTI